MSERIQLLILAVFAIAGLFLLLLNELMRQVTRVAGSWYCMIEAIRKARHVRQRDEKHIEEASEESV